jgi:hypothetical protein
MVKTAGTQQSSESQAFYRSLFMVSKLVRREMTSKCFCMTKVMLDGSHHPERAQLCPIIVNPQGHLKTNTML